MKGETGMNKSRLFAVLIAVMLICTMVFAAAAEENAFEATAYVRISIENYGDIDVELYGDEAPITVDNFLKLVDEGFYNGLTFHRIIAGFMMQGGDPLGNGMGGSEENIKGEFYANGVENNISHTRGTISMARAMDPNSGSSQFFIMHADGVYLDGGYAAFGRVISGMEVVDAVCENTPVVDNNGTVKDACKPVITSIVRIEKPEA